MAWAQVGNIKGPTGSTGSTGAPGTPGAPGVGFTWRGTWTNSTAYAINDVVSRTNQSYICVVANTGNDPAIDTTNWNLMAAQGAAGATGPQGPPGVDVNIATGTIWEWAGSTPPSGWLNCDGSAVSRTTYSALFAVIGTNFGAGDGSTTFNVPWLVAIVLGDNPVPGTVGTVTVYQTGVRIIKT